MTGLEQPYWGWGFAAAGCVLLGLYLWYRNAARREVSAIFLWDKPETTPKSGSRLLFRRLPWSFWVELAILALLALAAMTPFAMRPESWPPLAVILDDSYSMRAAAPGELSPRDAGWRAVQKQLAGTPGRRIVWIRAGMRPELLADGTGAIDPDQAWRAEASSADLGSAIALARARLKSAELLIVSDHAPEYDLPPDTGFLSFGRALGNTALVNCRRTAESILVEVANYGSVSQEGTLRLTPGGGASPMTLAPGERRKVVLKLPESVRKEAVTVEFDAPGDPLPFDNRQELLPEDREPIRFAFDPSLSRSVRPPLELVLDRLEEFSVRGGARELCFGGEGMKRGGLHRFFWHTGEEARAALTREKIAVRSDSPLTRGLQWDDVRWSADPGVTLPGEILIRRGDTPLFSAVRRMDGFWDFHWNMHPANSDPGKSPAWPALFWNIADMLRQERPGVNRANFRSGETVSCKLPPGGAAELILTLPDGTESRLGVVRGTGYAAGLPPGISTLRAGDQLWRVAVSGCNADESLLANAKPYQRLAALPPPGDEYPRRMLGFIPMLLAAGLLMLHQYKLGKSRNG